MNTQQPTQLSAHDLVVQIGQGEAGQHHVCCGLNFSLAAGQRLAILGRNGAGKSTLLSVLAGLRQPVAGDVLLQGKSYAVHGVKTAAKLRAWLGQHRGDAFSATVLETVLIGRHPHLGRWDWESSDDLKLARSALLRVGLHGFEQRDVQTLSGGERQRLAIAALLTQAPSLYLLDEPLAHLDLKHQIAMLELMQEQAAAGASVVMVLHEPALAWRYADQALLIYGDGRTALGSVDTMLTAEHLSPLYDYPLHVVEAHGQRCFIPQ